MENALRILHAQTRMHVESGLIQPIGDWLLWESCRHVRIFNDICLAGGHIAVDISALQLRHENLTLVVRGALAYLKHLPTKRLKLDQSFVRDIKSDIRDAVIYLVTVALGHNLGLEFIAEEVETRVLRDIRLTARQHLKQLLL